jgi:hypothetical protein
MYSNLYAAVPVISQSAALYSICAARMSIQALLPTHISQSTILNVFRLSGYDLILQHSVWLHTTSTDIQYVPLATEPGISLIILPLMRTLGALQTRSSSFLTQRTYPCSNFVAISSLVLELLKKCWVQ